MQFTIKFIPIGKEVIKSKPCVILDIARDAGLGLKSICGGKGKCGKCKVIVKPGSPVTEIERKLLTQDEIGEGYRLACRTTVKEDTEVYVPITSITEKQKLEIPGKEIRVKPFPPVRKFFLTLSKPSLSDVKSDFQRVKERLDREYGVRVSNIDFGVLNTMGPMLRESDWSVTVIARGKEIIGLEPGDTTMKSLGIAIDLGTTKIAVYLVNFLSGESVNIYGIMNSGIAYGEDILSRIHYAGNDGDNLRRLRRGVLKDINLAINRVCRQSKVKSGDILEATLVGNTAMYHIFLGLPVKQLGLAPFTMVTNEPFEIKAKQLGLEICSGGYLYLPPPIAGFVGSDHLAMLIASEIETKEGNLIAIDIGTNTEIALKARNKIVCCSCASGPAFEGAHIKHGMRAAPGAIEKVSINSRTLGVDVSTIGDKPPLGICGSGILDAISEMLRVGIIDSSGRMNSGFKGVRRVKGGKSVEFLLARDGDREIAVTQEDVSEIQLAKGAIRTGIEILLKETGLKVQDIDRVIIAGAFGTYIDPLKAVRIGMFPEIDIGKFVQIGNGAGIGAKAILISRKLREHANRLAKRIEYLELATHPGFFDHFKKAIRFPKME